MFGRLVTKAVVFGGVTIGAYGLNAYDNHDLNTNYTLVEAKVVSVKKDCFIKAGKSKVVYKDTSDLAYMPCEIAPAVAADNGFSKTAITEHAVVTYSYRSPVDKRSYQGTLERSGDIKAIKNGKKFQVHAHKTDADKSRAPKGNPFSGKAGV
ncbi:hypothetical protein [Roseibium sediminis]|uniref:hypothetical protein n=1 Tax=Roseibium sediminis TaxID=1775174 RepID=UPI00123D87B2|nr:hypothetical protein [Roseibium sediminis]